MLCAVILTALSVEYLAVRRHLIDLQEEMHPQGTIYERGKFISNENTWEVGIAEIGAGNAGASLEAERAIAYFKPDVLLFVGIALGIKEVKIGDVVAATKVYGYESGKAGDQLFIRPAFGQATYDLVQQTKAEARKSEWLKRLSSVTVPVPRVLVEPIAAGEKIIASRSSELYQFLRSSYNDAIAVEMEGYGFLSATFAHPSTKAIVIRGISEVWDSANDDSSQEEQQQKAAQHASAFAFTLLSKLDISPKYFKGFQTDSQSSIEAQQRLLIQQESLQANYNLKKEKYQRLKQSLEIETEPLVKFRIKKTIEELEPKVMQLERELNALEQNYSSS